MPRSTYIRRTALGAVPRRRPNQVQTDIVYHLAKIGANLNQLAHHANATGQLKAVRELNVCLTRLLRTLDELRTG